jgi:hypothetical protein
MLNRVKPRPLPQPGEQDDANRLPPSLAAAMRDLERLSQLVYYDGLRIASAEEAISTIATEPVTWDSIDKPAFFDDHPETSGLYINGDRLGYYDQTANGGLGDWMTYMDRFGDFFLNAEGADYLTWDSGTGTLQISGTIYIQNPGDLNTGDLNNDAGWTVGADWGTTLGGIPVRFGDAPNGAGLYLTANYLGYHDGSTLPGGGADPAGWQSYINSLGQFAFRGDPSNYILWNGTTLTIQGNILLPDGNPPLDSTALTNYLQEGQAYDDVFANPPPTSGSGLAITSSYLGFYDADTYTGLQIWRAYLDNQGNFGLRGTGNHGLTWNGSVLDITGSITITAGSSGYGQLTDRPTSLSEINTNEGSKLDGVESGATAGATWGANVSNIPIRFADTPSGAGLYLSATHLGYYANNVWQSYIQNNGDFAFTGDANNFISWNGSVLVIRGNLMLVDGTGILDHTAARRDEAISASNSFTTNQLSGYIPTGGAHDDVFNHPAPTTGSGLAISSTHLGFFNANLYTGLDIWRTYMNNEGNFYLTGTGNHGLSWSGNTLTITGAINIVNSQGNVEDIKTYVDNAALDASNIDVRARLFNADPPTGAGFWINQSHMGYYDGGSWLTYMGSNGHFYLTGPGTDSLTWYNGVLSVAGDLVGTDMTLSGSLTTTGSLILVDGDRPTLSDTDFSTRFVAEQPTDPQRLYWEKDGTKTLWISSTKFGTAPVQNFIKGVNRLQIGVQGGTFMTFDDDVTDVWGDVWLGGRLRLLDIDTAVTNGRTKAIGDEGETGMLRYKNLVGLQAHDGADWHTLLPEARILTIEERVNGLGVKTNHNTFTQVNAGEMYVHGFTKDVAADVDGLIYRARTRLVVPKGTVYTGQITPKGLLLFDPEQALLARTGAHAITPFAGSPTANTRVVAVRYHNGVWEYDDNTAWVSFTPHQTDLIIGTYRTFSIDHVNDVALFMLARSYREFEMTATDLPTLQKDKIFQLEDTLDSKIESISFNDSTYEITYTKPDVVGPIVVKQLGALSVKTQVEKADFATLLVAELDGKTNDVELAAHAKRALIADDVPLIPTSKVDGLDGQITDANAQQAAWVRNYAVRTLDPAELLGPDGQPLDRSFSYRVEAVTKGTGSTTSFVGYIEASQSVAGGGSFTGVTIEYQHGNTSNQPEIYLDGGVPKVRLYDHTSFYPVDVVLTKLSRTGPAVRFLEESLESVEASVSLHDGRINTVETILPTKASQAYVQSRGLNLITNGTGLLGDNTNFSAFQFDPADTYAGGGSFKFTAFSGGPTNNEPIPIDPALTYRISAYAKATAGVGGNLQTHYLALDALDIDGNQISPYTFMVVPGSALTTLSQPLNPGDTQIHVADATGWYNGATLHERTIRFYGYTNAKGYTYPPYTYSRDYAPGAWAEGGVNGATGVITLTQPWSGGSYPAGHPVANGQSGGSYKYCTSLGNSIVPEEWTEYGGEIGGVHTIYSNPANAFPPGTAFARLRFLLNRTENNGGSISFSNISMAEVVPDVRIASGITLTKVTGLQDTLDEKTNDIDLAGHAKRALIASDVPLLTLSKISDAGTAAAANTIDFRLASVKIAQMDLETTLSAKVNEIDAKANDADLAAHAKRALIAGDIPSITLSKISDAGTAASASTTDFRLASVKIAQMDLATVLSDKVNEIDTKITKSQADTYYWLTARKVAKADFTTGLTTELDAKITQTAANTLYRAKATPIVRSDLATGVTDELDAKANTASLAAVALSGNWSDVQSKPVFKALAFEDTVTYANLAQDAQLIISQKAVKSEVDAQINTILTDVNQISTETHRVESVQTGTDGNGDPIFEVTVIPRVTEVETATKNKIESVSFSGLTLSYEKEGVPTTVKTFGALANLETVGENQISNNSISGLKIKSGAVTNIKLGTDIDASKLSAGILHMDRIAAGAIGNIKLGNDLDASKLMAGTLPSDRIGPGSITNAKLGSDLNASKLTAGILPINRIDAGAIDNSKIHPSAGILLTKIAGSQVGVSPDPTLATTLNRAVLADDNGRANRNIEFSTSNLKAGAASLNSSGITISPPVSGEGGAGFFSGALTWEHPTHGTTLEIYSSVASDGRSWNYMRGATNVRIDTATSPNTNIRVGEDNITLQASSTGNTVVVASDVFSVSNAMLVSAATAGVVSQRLRKGYYYDEGYTSRHRAVFSLHNTTDGVTSNPQGGGTDVLERGEWRFEAGRGLNEGTLAIVNRHVVTPQNGSLTSPSTTDHLVMDFGSLTSDPVRVYRDFEATGDGTFGFTSRLAHTNLNVFAGNSYEATINLHGLSSGTGRLYLGQSATIGGGMVYMGDNTPSIPANMGGSGMADRIVFFRRTASGTSGSHWTAYYGYASNDWHFRGDVVADSTSDLRFKEDLHVIDGALNRISKISGYGFSWNDKIGEERAGKRQYGLIAQEVMAVLPLAVREREPGHLSLDYEQVIPLLVESIKEEKSKREALETRLARLEAVVGIA